MKTKKTLPQRVGYVIGVIFFIGIALIPAGIYAAVWLFIPKTFWPVFWIATAAITWLPIQIVWVLCVSLGWKNLNKGNTIACPPDTEESDGDLDISF
ncbi:MAG: hypothetical protein A2W52_03495 [Candidatus Taylorbacteria bacterium RIFCSPHIGHO2_02_49_25]|uniref:Uncharacterized protein n=1 Tax=Candidatus Taylorbacteria bacterium RIFCSPHIGHO2_02_49_25 TaxID=1802305 RepID=A0A1G2MFD3_9BACT|nr:MAG: hypothetical protein UY62_C0031G0002 [Parcubacteria group bacterium GW2011_GWF2_50_9]OHA20795.1 MAG: hypothetical protein A2759_03000 [Candidatus Taylorbacteria bacterium RIFCSPHIGHO2_01_FULL_49_60]OHA21869.1 MAG: hypothetical protein A2W52_03495 [Candidatus Taylorbacteria bacterium RIFCSPHIGHO2_02_49_25]OHA36677.1 MAG: hypothetical protein A3B27_01235 [Candidatus Taylorbacteria bacterium RIFCSPLOWO2_01_FULL_50_130]OHA37547.1 MAG: hypothetical protein A2W65_02950 [Candidatus Taylorbacte